MKTIVVTTKFEVQRFFPKIKNIIVVRNIPITL